MPLVNFAFNIVGHKLHTLANMLVETWHGFVARYLGLIVLYILYCALDSDRMLSAFLTCTSYAKAESLSSC